MKIAVVRGPSLNIWELQNYFPLAERHELLAIGSFGGHYEWGSQIQTKKLLCLGQVFSFIPGGIKFLYHHFGDPQIILGLEKAVSGFDVVHTAECSNYYSFQALGARKKGLCGKLAITCWENLPGIHEDYPAQRRIKKEVIAGADYFLAVTEQAKKALITDGAAPEKITVIPMGIDLNKFKIKQRRHNSIHETSIKKFTILFVGRLVEEKGVLELLEAFRLIRKQIKGFDLRLRIVGNGPLCGRIVQQSQEWEIPGQVSIEQRTYSEMPKVYQEADLFVLPSKPKKDWQEQFGMVLVEAMACGVPVIATRTGSIPEVVGEGLPAGRQAGILVEPGNVSEIAMAIGKIVKDGKLKTDLILKGLKRVRAEYNCQRVALKIENLYQKV